MRPIKIVCSLLLLLLLSGCGYHLPNRDASLPDDIQSVFIAPIVNQTTEPFIETQLTSEVRDQFSRQQGVDVAMNAERADALLRATITSYRSNAIAYNNNDDITEYRITIEVDAQLVRTNGEDIIWHGSVQWHEEFSANNDRSAQDYSETQAQEKAHYRLAQELYNRITDNF
jgi:outer membrane lipopolysaccharide assembly protein LptE/RlpB